MSAIFGIFRFDGAEVLARDLERMGNTLAYRGPDGRKAVVDGPVGLGHGLMRVNRDDTFETQPLRASDADVTLVADLRLDNRDELAATFRIAAPELRGLPDSALLLRAYKNGRGVRRAFARRFCLRDLERPHQETRARPRPYGPALCALPPRQGIFVFATDIKALWSYPDVPRVLSDVRIGRMLIHDRSPPEGETPFDGIHGLPGGTVMTVDSDGSTKKRRYWEPHADPVHQNRDEAYYIEAYRRVLGEAVACRVQAHNQTARPRVQRRL